MNVHEVVSYKSPKTSKAKADSLFTYGSFCSKVHVSVYFALVMEMRYSDKLKQCCFGQIFVDIQDSFMIYIKFKIYQPNTHSSKFLLSQCLPSFFALCTLILLQGLPSLYVLCTLILLQCLTLF